MLIQVLLSMLFSVEKPFPFDVGSLLAIEMWPCWVPNENVCLRYGSMSAFHFFEIILNRVVASLSLFTMCLALDCIQELYAFPYKYHLLASSVGFTRSYLLVTFFYRYTPVSLD